MIFLCQVINESLRITSTVPTMLRIVEHETHAGDYTIPAGWIFMGFPSVHFNPEKYEDPLAFNPWRWEVIPFILYTLLPYPKLNSTYPIYKLFFREKT